MFPHTPLKRARNSFLMSHDSDSECPSLFLSRASSQEDAFYGRYLMSSQNQILHIQITDYELIPLSTETYMVYVIKIFTENFGYQVKRRYSEFEALHTRISTNPLKGNFVYTFPFKSWSSSISTLFGSSTGKQKIAEQRKEPLNTFLNEIRTNFMKKPTSFETDYVEFLKFLRLKEETNSHENQKMGIGADLAKLNSGEKISQQLKARQKSEAVNSCNYLGELLQHEMNKLNLKDTDKNDGKKNINDQSLKIVKRIEQIVLELKKKINSNQIKSILLGENTTSIRNSNFQFTNSINPCTRVGLIEFCLSFSQNQLVSIQILKSLLDTFLNPESNYTAESFQKILLQAPPKILKVNSFNEELILSGGALKQHYFKFIEFYLDLRISIQLSEGKTVPAHKKTGKKTEEQQERSIEREMSDHILGEFMSNALKAAFEEWVLTFQKIKMKRRGTELNSIQELAEGDSLASSFRSPTFESIQSRHSPSKKSPDVGYELIIVEQQDAKDGEGYVSGLEDIESKLSNLVLLKKYEDGDLFVSMETQESEHFSYIRLVCRLRDNQLVSRFPQFSRIFSNEKLWNPLLKEESCDQFSGSIKKTYQFPGKQAKNFRFALERILDADLNQQEEKKYLLSSKKSGKVSLISLNGKKLQDGTKSMTTNCSEEDVLLQNPLQNDKKMTDGEQTCSMPCQHYKKVQRPLLQVKCNSFHTSIQLKNSSKQTQTEPLGYCTAKIQFLFQQPIVRKYFSSEVNGNTSLIWGQIISLISNY